MSTLVQPTLLATPKTFVPMMTRREVVNRIVEQCDVVYTDEQLAADLDEGLFEWVFNLSSAEESARAELRFFPGSVDARARRLSTGRILTPDISIETVLQRALPMALRHHDRTAVHGRILKMALACSNQLVLSLIRGGDLVQLGEARRGHGGDSVVTVASVQSLLETRRLQP